MSENQNQEKMGKEDHNCDDSCEHKHNLNESDTEPEPTEVIKMMQELLKESQNNTDNLSKRNKDLTKAFQELRDEYELSNNRHKKALEDSTKYACTDFAKILITAIDSFARAMDLTKAMPTVYLGLKMTHDTLEQEMKKYGIMKMYCELGAEPNPNLQQVIGEVDSAEHPVGTITQVIQNGYIIHDRILRHALVNVAKGESK